MLCGEVFHPLDVALDSLDQDEPIVSYLLSKGALTRMEWARKHDRLLFAELYESCDLFQAAIEQKNTAVLEFLTDIREYDVNVVCGEENDQISSTGVTPLDMAFGLFRGQRNEVSKVLFQSDAFSFSDLVHLVIRNSEDDYLGDDEDSEDGDE
uniref:Uncharacterized protein n=2 Tax=Entomoneis paludosa TaxID=265537 RepID=A0A7S2YA23_9STRA